MKKLVRAFLLAIYLCALFAVAGAQSRSLDGSWQFAVAREGKLTIKDLTSVKVEGVKAEDYDDVMSGIFLGWVNKNAALMAGARNGEGRAIITTFRLADAYGKDEYARRLLDEMIRLVSSEGFEPKLAIE